MLEYYDISGCYIIRPWAFNVWDTIHSKSVLAPQSVVNKWRC